MGERPDKASVLQSALASYQGPLLRYVARITGDVDRAADVVQETFLRLWSAQEPPSVQGLAQWLFTVGRNLALDIRRKERRMNALSEGVLAGTADAGEIPPDQAVEQNEEVQRALAALSHLSENQQEVVRLKFQNQFSYKEIAGITGLSVTNVGFLLHTAIKKIRQHLAQDGQPAPGLGAAP